MTDPLDEAIEAATNAVAVEFADGRRDAGMFVAFMASDGYTSLRGATAAETAPLAVRAAAPIIAAPILAERDELQVALNAATAQLRRTEQRRLAVQKSVEDCAAHLADEQALIADLRARLATAERDALLRAADAVGAEDEWLYHVARSEVADWLRERAAQKPGGSDDE